MEKKKQKHLYYAVWVIIACLILLIGYRGYLDYQLGKKVFRKGDDVDTLEYVYHNKLVPIGDSSEAHFMMGRRYEYLHDTVNAHLEFGQSRIWDKLGDSIIKKYHIIDIINRYKYPINNL